MKKVMLKTLKVLAGSIIVVAIAGVIVIMAINDKSDWANEVSHPLDPTPEIMTETILTEDIIVETIEVEGIEVKGIEIR